MTDNPVIYHNPDCSKSRQALSLLRDLGLDPTIRNYLEQPPSRDELLTLIGQLDDLPGCLIRAPEPVAPAAVAEGAAATARAVADLLIADPARLQRPIVVYNGKAIIARPPWRLLALIQGESH